MKTGATFIIGFLVLAVGLGFSAPSVSYAGELRVKSPKPRERANRRTNTSSYRRARISFSGSRGPENNKYAFANTRYAKELSRYEQALNKWENRKVKMQHKAQLMAEKRKLKLAKLKLKEKRMRLRQLEKARRRKEKLQRREERQKAKQEELVAKQQKTKPKQVEVAGERGSIKASETTVVEVPSSALGRRYSPGAAIDYDELPAEEYPDAAAHEQYLYGLEHEEYPVEAAETKKGFWQQLFGMS